MVTGDEARWANLASIRVFDKSLDALTSDFEKYAGAVPADLVDTLASVGRLIERAEARAGVRDPQNLLPDDEYDEEEILATLGSIPKPLPQSPQPPERIAVLLGLLLAARQGEPQGLDQAFLA